MSCSHLDDAAKRAHPVNPSSHGCMECLGIRGQWVHLRMCLTCGHVGCCDSSPNKHATRHFHDTGHPVIRSYEPTDDWAWCYVDEGFGKHFAALPGEAAEEHYDPPNY